MRYNKAQIKRGPTGKRHQESVSLSRVPLSENDMYIEVTTTDRLDLISYKYYGTIEYWWLIANVNGVGKGTMAIQEGGILRLPANPQSVSGYSNGVG